MARKIIAKKKQNKSSAKIKEERKSVLDSLNIAKNELESLTKEKEGFFGDVEKKRGIIVSLKKEIDHLNEQIAKKRIEYDDAKASAEAELKKIRESEKSAHDSIVLEKEGLLEYKKEINSEIQEKKREVRELDKDINGLKDALENKLNAIAKVDKVISEQSNRLEGDKEKINSLEDMKPELEAKIAGLKNEIRSLEKTKKASVDLSKENKKIQDSISKKRTELKGLEDKVQEARGNLIKAKAEVSSRETAVKEKEKELDEREKSVDRTAKTLQKHLDKLDIPIKVT